MTETLNTVDLRERIALCDDFTPDERALILDSVALGDYSDKHRYPPNGGPNRSAWLRMAWAILDQLPPSAMKENHRFILGGLFAGALMELAGTIAATARQQQADVVKHAAPNYLGRIEHIYAALSVDDGGEGVVAAPLGNSGVTAALIAADKARVDSFLRPVAREVAKMFGKPVRIAKFTAREDVEVFQP